MAWKPLPLTLVLTLTATAWAQLPSQTLPVSGVLTDAAGSPQTGAVDLNFAIYDVATGGMPVWNETHLAVPLSAMGRYQVTLGSLTPLDASLFAPPERWLGIQVLGDVEMTPRLALSTVPAAHNANLLEGIPASEFAPRPELADLSTLTSPVHWQGLVGIPLGLDDGDDDTTYTAGPGLLLGANTFSVAFAGTGVLPQVSRTDHNHDTVYIDRPTLRTSDGSAPNLGSNLVHWDILTGVPPDIVDGDDGRNYLAGAGLNLAVDTFSVDFAGSGVATTAARSDHSHGGGGGGGTLDSAYDGGGAGAGRTIQVDAGAVDLDSAVPMGTALDVDVTGASSIGIDADNTATGVALRARSTDPANTFSTVQAETASGTADAAALLGNSTGTASGVAGQVMMGAVAEQGVLGSNLRTTGGHGVRGIGFNGVVGETNYSTGNAVFGENTDTLPPLGNAIGVAGIGYYGVIGQDRYLGGAAGAYGVFANGELGASGVKTFRIDHPLAPADRYLVHFSVESPEVLNLYRGTARCGADGTATIQLPDYFSAINRNLSYHLTPIGGAADLFIASEIDGERRFRVGGGREGLKVSWLVMAERNDPYLRAHPEKRTVEPLKTERDRGRFQMPALHGAAPEDGIFPAPGAPRTPAPLSRK